MQAAFHREEKKDAKERQDFFICFTFVFPSCPWWIESTKGTKGGWWWKNLLQDFRDLCEKHEIYAILNVGLAFVIDLFFLELGG
ncbi:MAG: hypothetical protein JW862_00090 [Anaerolineales bacterium]|nr:hypothetical protein [Anaerolineales bacterium]